MMAFPPFGDPWNYRLQGASGNSIQGTKKKIKVQDFFTTEENITKYNHF